MNSKGELSPMSDIELLRILLINLKKIKQKEAYVSYCYSVMITFFLSEEIFKRNIDIQPFLESNHIEFKPYVYKNRTTLIARVSRFIEKASYKELEKIIKSIHEIIFFEKSTPKKNNDNTRSDDNYIDSLLEQFSRRD